MGIERFISVYSRDMILLLYVTKVLNHSVNTCDGEGSGLPRGHEKLMSPVSIDGNKTK